MNRFSENTGTCYGKNFNNFFDGFFSQFQDSFFYANVIQFLLVTLMYIQVGNGKYWHLLFYASVAACMGALIENITVAFICLDKNKLNGSWIFTFLIAEIFWASCQFSIPFLNLIKMRAFSKGKLVNVIKYIIIGLSFPFALCRFIIGFERMRKGYLVDDKINTVHGFAFGLLAISDFICTVTILYIVKKNNTLSANNSSDISNYIKTSSYTILVTVDILGFLLSVFDIIINFKLVEFLPPSTTVPFQCLMSNFILILAVDALLFKYGANVKFKNNSSNAIGSKYTIGNNNSANCNSFSLNNSTANSNKIKNNDEIHYNSDDCTVDIVDMLNDKS